MLTWIKNHFNTLNHLILTTSITSQMGEVFSLAKASQYFIEYVHTIKSIQGKIIFIGNGGSAGIASHLAIDYAKNGEFPAMSFSDPSAMTCLSNDFGFEFVFSKQLEYIARREDMIVAISSSGQSLNIINAANTARWLGCELITFTGFDNDNPLKTMGNLNFHVNSHSYGFVEVAHLALGHAMLDFILEARNNKSPEVTNSS